MNVVILLQFVPNTMCSSFLNGNTIKKSSFDIQIV